jgi:hypothetical protein
VNVGDVRLDHGRVELRVAKQLLSGPDIRAGLEEGSRERVLQRVWGRVLFDARAPDRVVTRSVISM